jgi:hypothetical protein
MVPLLVKFNLAADPAARGYTHEAALACLVSQVVREASVAVCWSPHGAG